MKILYEKTSRCAERLEGQDVSLAELPLPEPVYTNIKEQLERSNGVLPDSARSLNSWTVGLLDRFDPE